MTISINKHKRFQIPYTQNTNFQPLTIINGIRQTKYESKIYIKLQNFKAYFSNEWASYPVVFD